MKVGGNTRPYCKHGNGSSVLWPGPGICFVQLQRALEPWGHVNLSQTALVLSTCLFWLVRVSSFVPCPSAHFLTTAPNTCYAIQAAPNFPYFVKGTKAGARLFQIIHRKPTINAEAPGERPTHCSGQLELRNVSFAYPAMPERMVLM